MYKEFYWKDRAQARTVEEAFLYISQRMESWDLYPEDLKELTDYASSWGLPLNPDKISELMLEKGHENWLSSSQKC